MARPRKDSEGPSARERIIDAFWSLLEETPFDQITVSALLRRAGVSPNTLYYHFSGYDEVVRSALDATLDPRAMTLLIGDDVVAHERLPENLQEKFKRVVAFASDKSGRLPILLRAALKRAWLSEMGLSEDELTPIEEWELDFIFAGVVSLLAGIGTANSVTEQGVLREFFQRSLGKGILGTLEELQKAF